MKRKMVLADCDERYLRELSYYFMENVPQLELITFTKRERMCRYFEDNNRADILMVDETFADSGLKEMTPGLTRIVMSKSMVPVDGFEPVKKYQRMETLSDTVLLKYAENKGTLETVKGRRHRKDYAGAGFGGSGSQDGNEHSVFKFRGD